MRFQMRRVFPTAFVPFLLTCTHAPARVATPAPRDVVPLSKAARTCLGTALDTLQRVVLGADRLPWARIRDSAFAIAEGAA